jgi:adenylate cyclase
MPLVGPSLDRRSLHATRTLLFADVVESVRLFRQDESGAVSRWLDLIDQIATQILPVCSGRLVKRMGDGFLVEFEQVSDALSAAFAIHHASHHRNHGLPPEQHLLLRIGIGLAEVILVQGDVLGHGVNMAQRLTSLAGAGETVVSARARDQMIPELDGDIEDLGDCYLRHIVDPVRAYRVGPPGLYPVVEAGLNIKNLLPAIAVVPFETWHAGLDTHLIGEAIADEMIEQLSKSPDLTVISRLTTSLFRGRDMASGVIGAHLQANYILAGSYAVESGTISLQAELAEAKSGVIVWAGALRSRVTGIIGPDHDPIDQIVAEIRAAIAIREVQRTRTQSLPNLQGYTLLMAALTLMHRLSLHDFEESHHLLLTLTDRARRQPLPQAWLAKWHVLRVQQGWSPDAKQDAREALQCTRQALDSDPDCSLALAVDGIVHTTLLKRLDIAAERYDKAIASNPNDSLAWLLRGTMYAFMGQGERAMADTQWALRLSPFDPHRHFYESLAGTACLAAGEYERALRHGQRSLLANKTHTSTLRVIAIAQWRLGFGDDARHTVARLLKLDPGLTVARYLERTPAAPFATGRDWSDALHQAGLPA